MIATHHSRCHQPSLPRPPSRALPLSLSRVLSPAPSLPRPLSRALPLLPSLSSDFIPNGPCGRRTCRNARWLSLSKPLSSPRACRCAAPLPKYIEKTDKRFTPSPHCPKAHRDAGFPAIPVISIQPPTSCFNPNFPEGSKKAEIRSLPEVANAVERAETDMPSPEGSKNAEIRSLPDADSH